MQILVKKISGIGLWCFLALPAWAQAPAIPSIPNVPTIPSVNIPSNINVNNTDPATLEYLYHHKADDGTVIKDAQDKEKVIDDKEKAIEALGFRQVSTDFVNYLAMTGVTADELKAYNDESDLIFSELKKSEPNVAWHELDNLGKFTAIDGRFSGELSRRVKSVADANTTKMELANNSKQLERQMDTDSRNADMQSQEVQREDAELQRELALQNGTGGNNNSGGNNSSNNQSGTTTTTTTGTGSTSTSGTSSGSGNTLAPQDNSAAANGNPNTPSSSGFNKVGLGVQYGRVGEDEAERVYDQAKGNYLRNVSEANFTTYITDLYAEKRYENVIMAANFWQEVFNEGDYPATMGQEVNESLDAKDKVSKALDAFKTELTSQNIAMASDDLQQAYLASPHDPLLLAVNPADKIPIAIFVKQLQRVQSAIEAEDFGNLETLLNDMKKTAPDFDPTKAMAIVNGIKLESQLHLGRAKIAFEAGDIKTAEDEFKQAAQVWPGNPDVQKESERFFDSEDSKNKELEQLDRYVADGNYEAIAEHKFELAPAVQDDKKRLDQLEDALKKAELSQMALLKAQAMQANGNSAGAWEAVQLAIKDLPDDNKLNSLRADLAAQASEFVSAISKAEAAENRQDLGYSLTWFAVAQQNYPASQIANDAIQRLSKEILDKSSITPSITQ